MRIGFVGVGNMGAGMARNLVKAGHEVSVFDLDEDRTAPLGKDGATVAKALAEAVEGAEAVITMLPSAQAVRAVIADVLDAAAKGALLIDCSTIDVETARAVAKDAKDRGHALLDAPVSGGTAGADAGTLAFMVGGDEAAFGEAAPLFGVMGAKAVHCGAAGAGQATKICNNMMLAIQMISVAEGFALAEALGLKAQTLFDVSSAASGQCWSLTTYCPVAGVGPETPADRDFKPGFAAALMRKDLGLALEAAERNDAHVPFGAAARRVYERMMSEGEGDRDFSYVIRRVRDGTTGIDIGTPEAAEVD